MAGDGRETAGIGTDSSAYVVRDDCPKVFKLTDGRLYGGAHASESIIRLQNALEAGEQPPQLSDIAGLMIDTRGRMWLYEGNIWQRLNGKYYAIGSGAFAALCAMDAGATAIEAVRIGIRRDVFSGGKLTSVRLGK